MSFFFLKDFTTTVVTTVMCFFRFLFEHFPNSLWKLMNQWKNTVLGLLLFADEVQF